MLLSRHNSESGRRSAWRLGAWLVHFHRKFLDGFHDLRQMIIDLMIVFHFNQHGLWILPLQFSAVFDGYQIVERAMIDDALFPNNRATCAGVL